MTGRSKMTALAREALSHLPLLNREIRHYAAYDKAALEGCPVYEVRDDRNAKIAWTDYAAVAQELLAHG
jgi:chromosome partitioning protein